MLSCPSYEAYTATYSYSIDYNSMVDFTSQSMHWGYAPAPRRLVTNGTPWDTQFIIPISQLTKSSSWNDLLKSRRGLVLLRLHILQCQRCAPAAVLLRFCSLLLHTEQ
jgi:hypothetical protein